MKVSIDSNKLAQALQAEALDFCRGTKRCEFSLSGTIFRMNEAVLVRETFADFGEKSISWRKKSGASTSSTVKLAMETFAKENFEEAKTIVQFESMKADYEELINAHYRNVRALDVLINGSNSANAPAFVDLLTQIRIEGIRSKNYVEPKPRVTRSLADIARRGLEARLTARLIENNGESFTLEGTMITPHGHELLFATAEGASGRGDVAAAAAFIIRVNQGA